MALRKNPKYDLKAKYSRVLAICMISSLSFLVAAFKFFPAIEAGDHILKDSQELINVEDVIITKRDALPPPPPKPPIPIEAPESDIEMEDIELALTELNEDDKIIGPPPPPPKDTEAEPAYIFVAAEDQPAPIGGIEGIMKRIEYPEFAKRAGIQGLVFVEAYVDENGDVQKTELRKGIGAGCDEEAVKAVTATKFTPGRQRGKPVKVRITVPIRFVLR